MSVFERLDLELDEWTRLGFRPAFWVRDDDVVDDTAALRRLINLAATFQLKFAFAVIPTGVTGRLVELFRLSQFCVAWQHGNRHVWEDSESGIQKGEFGAGRSMDALARDALIGQQAMDSAFGEGNWERVFVPPFHALDAEFKILLPALGFKGISAGNPRTRELETVREINAPIDLINWKQRRFAGREKIVGEIVDELRRQRTAVPHRHEPLGILTHHLAFDEDCWDFLSDLLQYLQNQSGCDLLSADGLFDSQGVEISDHVPDQASVALVITSCGRQDLLERTLRSFLAVNEHPLAEIIVIEDGDGSVNDRLKTVFHDRGITWLETGRRVGQVEAIDQAYAACRSKYIFHCEDDWEFYRGGFIRESLTLLERHDWLLQIWLRSLGDTNKHPLLDLRLKTDGIEFRLLAPNHNAGEWGEWHGFSWNPGLRRRSDYVALGTFGALDPGGSKETWRVESDASIFYKRRGLLAAILATNSGAGYVRHIGKGRRVSREIKGR